MGFDEVTGITKVTLEKLKFGLQQRVSAEIMADLGLRVDVRLDDYIANNIVIAIRGYVWSETLERYEIVYPTDWWQALKERWLPGRLKLRWPVKYKRHVIDLKVIYPDLKVSLPNEVHRLRLIKQEFGI